MSYTATDFADDIDACVEKHGAPPAAPIGDDSSDSRLAHLAIRVALALEQRTEMIKVLRDVAALLPAAGRMHPQDLHRLQTRVCEALAKAGAT